MRLKAGIEIGNDPHPWTLGSAAAIRIVNHAGSDAHSAKALQSRPVLAKVSAVRTNRPVVKDLVLIGGGHAHVAVLRACGMRPLPDVRMTLISAGAMTPYSGMLPGLIAGHYTYEEAHIDLGPLSAFARAQFYKATATGLDLEQKTVLLKDRPPVRFDLVSIDIGSLPARDRIPAFSGSVIPVKPVDRFLAAWEDLRQEIAERKTKCHRFIIVGGGAGGVELALSLQYRLGRRVQPPGDRASRFAFQLVTRSEVILPGHNPRVREKFLRILSERNISVVTGQRVTGVSSNQMVTEAGRRFEFERAFWVTHASAPRWIGESGLATDQRGFMTVNQDLQSLSHPFVFGVGDIATMPSHPRPKSGVFAVRQGPALAENLRHAVAGEPLDPFVPQAKFLSLVSTGNPYAIASRGRWAAEGAWVWRWKDRIDRRWMRQYQELPDRAPDESSEAPARGQAPAPEMRCGGCGSKVGGTMLYRVLHRLGVAEAAPDILVGLRHRDDGAVFRVPEGQVLVQSVDYFRSFLDDPWLFGRITANHGLSDLFAMGARARTAQVIAVVPYGDEKPLEEQLFQLMSGVMDTLRQHGVQLLGGHSAEGQGPALGLTVNGFATPEDLIPKRDVRPKQCLILTKRLGSGILFAGAMRGRAKSKDIDQVVESMLQSNETAIRCLRQFHLTACTDVTGFGLVGHLSEMLEERPIRSTLSLSRIPAFEGAEDLLRQGIQSSLQPQNLRFRESVDTTQSLEALDRFKILFDPQTSGGLLASVPEAEAESCQQALVRAGFRDASIIGATSTRKDAQRPIEVL